MNTSCDNQLKFYDLEDMLPRGCVNVDFAIVRSASSPATMSLMLILLITFFKEAQDHKYHIVKSTLSQCLKAIVLEMSSKLHLRSMRCIFLRPPFSMNLLWMVRPFQLDHEVLPYQLGKRHTNTP